MVFSSAASLCSSGECVRTDGNDGPGVAAKHRFSWKALTWRQSKKAEGQTLPLYRREKQSIGIFRKENQKVKEVNLKTTGKRQTYCQYTALFHKSVYIDRSIYRYKNSLLTPVGDMCLPQPWVVHQSPGSLRVLRSILAVPITALFWTESSDVVPGICWSHSSSLGVTAPSVPITTGTALTLTFHVLFSSSFSLSFSRWYFSSFSYSFFFMLLSLGTAMSITTVSLEKAYFWI